MRPAYATIPVLILLTASQAIPAFQQPAGTASVEGTVTNSGTGAPIQAAKVTLIFVPPPAPPRLGEGGVSMIADRFLASTLPPTITSSAPANASPAAALTSTLTTSVFTDSNGGFTFRNLGAGSYRLAVDSNGYVGQEYRQTNRVLPVSPIQLAEGQALTGIAFRLVPTGTVSGRVLDLSGQPVAGVPINLYRPGYNPTGEWNPTLVATVRSNDRGEYRIFWITPGRHYVMAGGNAATGRPVASVNNDVLDSFSYAFCPQGSDIENATAVDIRPGGEVTGCDFRVSQLSFYRITGRVIDSRTGQTPTGASVSIASRSPIGARGSSGGRVYNDPASGTFEITDVAPGNYNLTSVLNDRTIAPGPNTFGALSASTVVRVVSADVRDVILTITERQSVSGQVTADSPLPPGMRLQVRLMPSSSAIDVQGVATQVTPDGTFTFAGGSFRQGPADYRVTLTNAIAQTGLPAGWYLKEAKLDETDALNGLVRLPSSGSLSVVLSSKGGQISGIVRNDRQQPVVRVDTLLIPDSPRERTDLFQRSLTDPTGRFNFPNVPPGNYKLFAFEGVFDSAQWFDPEWLKDYESKGVAISIGESSRETRDLTTIPLGGGQ